MKPTINAEPEQAPLGSPISVSWANAPAGARLFAVEYAPDGGDGSILHDYPLGGKANGRIEWFAPSFPGIIDVTLRSDRGRRLAEDEIEAV